MSPEEVVRRFFELGAQGDRAGVAELLDPDVVWFGTRGGLDANRTSRGTEAFLDYMQEIEETWQRLEIDVERVIESGETVVAFLHESARGRGDLDVERETAVVFRVRGGKLTEARGYLDRGAALEATGLGA